jgi:hypothetical protein
MRYLSALRAVVAPLIPILLFGCQRGVGLRYPGNGLPDLAKDLPIVEFNQGMFAQLRQSPGFHAPGQKLFFTDASAARYVYPQPLLSRTFAMIHEVGGGLGIGVAAGRVQPSPPADPLQAQRSHQSSDPLSADVDPLLGEVLEDPRHAVACS